MTAVLNAALASDPQGLIDVIDMALQVWEPLGLVRWHDHRHTFASWARMAGVDIADIADALFHSGIQMTTRYAHITPEHASTAWSRVATNSPLAAGQGKEEE